LEGKGKMKEINLSDPKVLDAFNKLAKRRWGLLLALMGIGSFSSVIIAGVQAVGWMIALWLGVNFVLPPVANFLALMKVKSMRLMAEELSIETLQKDEQEEGARLEQMRTSYKETESSLGASIEELQESLKSTRDEAERSMVQNQIDQLQTVIDSQFSELSQREVDFKELVRVNGLLIKVDKAARAMNKAQHQERDSTERQQLVTAREAIKGRMRHALAGQRVDQMRQQLGVQMDNRVNVVHSPQLGTHQPKTIEMEVQRDGQKVVR
jgi:molecular chaperone GrpE (heat shock protein)